MDAPDSTSTFYPINLINSYFKIISKILPIKLSRIIDKLTDATKSAFFKGRYIMDNVVTMEEQIFSLQKRRIIGNIIKVNFAKPLDMVDWGFLLELLFVWGFGSRWIGWIKSLLQTSKSTIVVNSSQEGYIRYQRGLRQGDPLSLMLFVLVMDTLSAMFTHALTSRVLYGVPIGQHGNLCHF